MFEPTRCKIDAAQSAMIASVDISFHGGTPLEGCKSERSNSKPSYPAIPCGQAKAKAKAGQAIWPFPSFDSFLLKALAHPLPQAFLLSVPFKAILFNLEQLIP